MAHSDKESYFPVIIPFLYSFIRLFHSRSHSSNEYPSKYISIFTIQKKVDSHHEPLAVPLGMGTVEAVMRSVVLVVDLSARFPNGHPYRLCFA